MAHYNQMPFSFSNSDVDTLLGTLTPELSDEEKDALTTQEILLHDPFAQGFEKSGPANLDELEAIDDLIEQLFPNRHKPTQEDFPFDLTPPKPFRSFPKPKA